RLATAGGGLVLGAVPVARILGRRRALDAHPCPSARARFGARAIYLFRTDLDEPRRLSRVRRCADAVDVVRRGGGHSVGALSALRGAQEGRRARRGARFRYLHAVMSQSAASGVDAERRFTSATD